LGGKRGGGRGGDLAKKRGNREKEPLV